MSSLRWELVLEEDVPAGLVHLFESSGLPTVRQAVWPESVAGLPFEPDALAPTHVVGLRYVDWERCRVRTPDGVMHWVYARGTP